MASHFKRKKIVYVVGDGIGDRPVRQLGYKTPLEVARTPNLDSLVKSSMVGLIYTIAPGVPPGSDTAHLALLGYDPFEVYSGRGPFEALGAGYDLEPGEVAFRANFATVDEKGIVLDRRAGRYLPEAEELTKAINESVEIESYPDVKFRFLHTVDG